MATEAAYQRCIVPSCGAEYGILETRTCCERGHLLDTMYREKPNPELLKTVFRTRRNHGGNIFNESGVWRFRELLNFAGVNTEDYEQCSKVLVSRDGHEGLTKPYHMTKVAEHVGMPSENLWLQPEGDGNCSGSFKDRGMPTAMTHAKMVGATELACASTGNTSASLALYAGNEVGRMKAHVYVPKGQIAPGKLGQAFQFGAEITEAGSNFDEALAALLRDAKTRGFYIMNSINPFRLEGQKTIIISALERLDWRVPDWIAWPYGNGGNTAAFGKALDELLEWGFIDKKPRVAAVNAAGANTLYTLFNGHFKDRRLRWDRGDYDAALIEEFYARDIKPKTVASAIQIGKPVNLPKGLRTLEHYDGIVVQVSDEEMLDGMAIAGQNGFDIEPASAATIAGIKQLREEQTIAKDDVVLGILTGRNKDPQMIVDYHIKAQGRYSRPPRRAATA